MGNRQLDAGGFPSAPDWRLLLAGRTLTVHIDALDFEPVICKVSANRLYLSCAVVFTFLTTIAENGWKWTELTRAERAQATGISDPEARAIISSDESVELQNVHQTFNAWHNGLNPFSY